MASVAPGGKGKKRRLNAEMNVVPYIDVMLVLLIIFMVTAPLLTQGIEVELPETEGTTMTDNDKPVTLSVNRDGEFFLTDGDNPTDPLTQDQLVQRATDIVQKNPKEMFLVEGDAKVPYENVARGMALLQSAGVTKIGFVTSPAGPPAAQKKR